MAKIEIRIPDWLDKIFSWPLMQYRKYRFGEPYRRIYLGQGKFTIVSPPDYYRFNIYNWCPSIDGLNIYAVRVSNVNASGRRGLKIISLHREILNTPPGVLVDHRNNYALDNRMSNLRPATKSQNLWNRGKYRKNCSSKFKGASFDKKGRKWIACIDVNGKRIYLGRFDSEIDAARAYDRAAIKYHGEFAKLNFPREDYKDEMQNMAAN